MGNIVHCYRQDFPKCRFVGIRYTNPEQAANAWGEWFSEERFENLETLLTPEFCAIYPDTDAYVSLTREGSDVGFESWIGMFLPENSPVPQGFESMDFQHSYAGICWIQGAEQSLYGQNALCRETLCSHNLKIASEADGTCWFFERYTCPRFTTPDENGEVILDAGYFVEK